MATFKQALEYASKNPNSDFAKFLTERIQSGAADDEARQGGIDLTPIKSLIKPIEQKPQEPGYLSRVGTEFQKTGQEIVSGIETGAKGIEEAPKAGIFTGVKALGTMLRTGLRTAGGVAKAAFAPIIEAPVIKPALEKLGEAITKIPGAEQAIIKLNNLAEKYPEEAKDIQNAIDIIALTGLKAIEKPAGAVAGKVAIKAGRTLEESGLTAAKVAKESFAKELVMPVRTAAVKAEQVARTTETGTGIFKRSIIKPTTLEQRAIDEVAKIPEISTSKTFQQNYNILKSVNASEAEKLVSDIAANDFIISKKEILAKLNRAAENLADNPVIVGDAEKTAQRLINGARKIINENEGTGSGLLKARKDYDIWVQNQKPKVFDATSENAFTIANREVRQTINNTLDEKIPDVGVKESLRRQSSLYYAMENIETKAAQEADTAILRIMQKVGQTLGTKNRIVQGVAAAAGIGGLGAAATFAPAAAVAGGIGFVIWKGGKLILKPEVRIAIGKLLQGAGKLLNSEDKKILENALNIYKD